MKIINVAKTVVLDPDSQVLLLKRSATDKNRPGEWDFPGGWVDPGESPEQAARREAQEEAGLELGDMTTVYCATGAYEDASVNRTLFCAHVKPGDVRLSNEHETYKWVSVDEALELFPHPFYGVGLRYARDHGLL